MVSVFCHLLHIVMFVNLVFRSNFSVYICCCSQLWHVICSNTFLLYKYTSAHLQTGQLMETHWAKLGIQGMEAFWDLFFCSETFHWSGNSDIYPGNHFICLSKSNQFQKITEYTWRKLGQTCEGSAPLNTWQKNWIILIKYESKCYYLISTKTAFRS